jgi:hypothetical protein
VKKLLIILSIILTVSLFMAEPVFADDLVIVEGLDQLGDNYYVDFGKVCQGATAAPRTLLFKLKYTDASFEHFGKLIISNYPYPIHGFTADIGEDDTINLPADWDRGFYTISEDTATGIVGFTAGEETGSKSGRVGFRAFDYHFGDSYHTVILIARVVKCYSIDGFYTPVGMDGVWNTVKGGSTVPLKFNIMDDFSGEPVTSTDWATLGFNFNLSQVACTDAVGDEEPIEETASGGTSLRYDFDGGNFVYNWQMPKTKSCYKATLTVPGDSITAYFKLK